MIPPEIIAAIIRHPVVAAALRDAVGTSAPDEWIPTPKVAATFGVPHTTVTESWSKKGLRVCGPKGARVVRRGDLDEWIAARGIEPSTKAKTPKVDEREEARASIAKLAARMKRSA